MTKVSLSAKGAAQMGSIIGSTLGGYLAGGDKLKGVAFSSILGAIGAQIGAAIATGASLESVMSSANMTACGADAWNRLQSAAVGSVSSLLTMELGQALGLQGFGAELFNTAGSSFTNKALTNIIEKGPSKKPAEPITPPWSARTPASLIPRRRCRCCRARWTRLSTAPSATILISSRSA